jgi:hypothetical protein
MVHELQRRRARGHAQTGDLALALKTAEDARERASSSKTF